MTDHFRTAFYVIELGLPPNVLHTLTVLYQKYHVVSRLDRAFPTWTKQNLHDIQYIYKYNLKSGSLDCSYVSSGLLYIIYTSEHRVESFVCFMRFGDWDVEFHAYVRKLFHLLSNPPYDQHIEHNIDLF